MRKKRPLKHSCFTEQQIQFLFDRWVEFVRQKSNNAETLINTVTTIENKYASMPLRGKEINWVMFGETGSSFIKEIQSHADWISRLRMSFPPPLRHRYDLEIPDITELFRRFRFWHRELFNVNGVIDLGSRLDGTINNIIEDLTKEWANSRYHVAIIHDDRKWYTIMIDREHSKLTFYDPLNEGISIDEDDTLIGVYVRQIYDRAIALDPRIRLHTYDTGPRRSKHPAVRTVLFVYDTLIFGLPSDPFYTKEECVERLKDFFIQSPGKTGTTQVLTTTRLPYGEYDVRVAMLLLYNLAVYQNNPVATQIKEHMISNKPYVNLLVYGSELGEKIGEDVWQTRIQSVLEDPLTIYLRKNRFTTRKTRSGFILQAWKQMEMMATDEIRKYTLELVRTTMVPILRGKTENKRRYDDTMTVEEYLTTSTENKESVSFAVQLLRFVNDRMLQEGVMTVPILSGKFQPLIVPTKTITPATFVETARLVNACNKVIEEAEKLVKSTLVTALTQQPNTPMSTQSAETTRITTIPALNQRDVRQPPAKYVGKIIKDGPQPWNFPFDVTEFKSSFGGNFFKDYPNTYENSVYNITGKQIEPYLNDRDFVTNYAIGVLHLIHAMPTVREEFKPKHIRMVTMSIMFMYNYARDYLVRTLMCYLLDQFHKAVQGIGKGDILTDLMAIYHEGLKCDQSKLVDVLEKLENERLRLEKLGS